jgi:hypothetical protein
VLYYLKNQLLASSKQWTTTVPVKIKQIGPGGWWPRWCSSSVLFNSKKRLSSTVRVAFFYEAVAEAKQFFMHKMQKIIHKAYAYVEPANG